MPDLFSGRDGALYIAERAAGSRPSPATMLRETSTYPVASITAWRLRIEQAFYQAFDLKAEWAEPQPIKTGWTGEIDVRWDARRDDANQNQIEAALHGDDAFAFSPAVRVVSGGLFQAVFVTDVTADTGERIGKTGIVRLIRADYKMELRDATTTRYAVRGQGQLTTFALDPSEIPNILYKGNRVLYKGDVLQYDP